MIEFNAAPIAVNNPSTVHLSAGPLFQHWLDLQDRQFSWIYSLPRSANDLPVSMRHFHRQRLCFLAKRLLLKAAIASISRWVLGAA